MTPPPNQEKEPLFVTFARVCMGWTSLCRTEKYWMGLPPNALWAAEVPRVDLPGYDLNEWEEKNRLAVYPYGAVWTAEPQVSTGLRYYDEPSRRLAVLRCLIALFEAGKGVRP